MDTNRIGIFGHSFGGAAAGESCLNDSRFKAFVNLDGSPFGDTVDSIIQQPFMVLTTGSDGTLKFKVQDGYAQNQTNFLVVGINGSQHMNFTDFNTIIPYAGKALGALGSINSAHQTDITNAYLLAFFNHNLKWTDEPLLGETTSAYDDVTVEQR